MLCVPNFDGDKWGMKEKFIEGVGANSRNQRKWGEWGFETFDHSI